MNSEKNRNDRLDQRDRLNQGDWIDQSDRLDQEDQLDQIQQASAVEGRTTNVGFQNPNSPLDLADLDPLPESGGIGAQDPAAGEDLEGEDQVHAREIGSGARSRSGQALGSTPNVADQDEETSGGSSTSW